MAEIRLGTGSSATLATLLPGTVGDLAWSSRWGSGPSGPDKASWTQSLPFTFDDSRLVAGQRVSVVRGGQTLWAGVLTDVQRGEPWSFDATGLGKVAEDFLALDSSSNPTTNVGTAVSQAVTRGLPWSGTALSSLGSFGTNDGTDYATVASLLTGFHDRQGLRWGVTRNGVAFSSADDTTPRWLLDGHDVVVGMAEDDLSTVVVARYQSGVGTYASAVVSNAAAVARYGRREYPLDLTDLGTLTLATAQTYANQVLAALVSPSWVNQITVTRDRLTTPGGVPADLATVRAGQAVQVFGIPGRLGRLSGSGLMTVMLGGVSYVDGAEEITLAPTRLARRTLGAVLERFRLMAEAQRAAAEAA